MGKTERLQSWKEIADYLGRSVATVQRWERDEGLPVHRHFHQKIATVYAHAGEIDHWRAGSRQPAVAPTERSSKIKAGSSDGSDEYERLSVLSIRAFLRGDTSAAVRYATSLIEVAEAVKDDALRAKAYIDLAVLELDIPQRSAEHVQQALAVLRNLEATGRIGGRGLFVEARVLSALSLLLARTR